MKAKKALNPATGVAIPLGALRTEKAVGEFRDLVALAAFCKKVGLAVIQILPVNDSGGESSPYSALSAFALNPLYITVEDVPGYDSASKSAKALAKFHRDHKTDIRFDYYAAREAKLAALRSLLPAADDADLDAWVTGHQWVKPYAVYMTLKAAHKEASWKDWPAAERALGAAGIDALWKDAKLWDEHRFWAWVQMIADTQFAEAADAVAKEGIILKGDLPILMAEDSCDVWAHPEYFDHTQRAGAPPDMYNRDGQNWGFPVYRWDTMAQDGYAWWKERIKMASRYYKAYRLDHILGFFRIWETGEREKAALMGRCDPIVPVTVKDLENNGLDSARIRWLSEPHVPTNAIEAVNNHDYLGSLGLLETVMDRVGTEELWLFKKQEKGGGGIGGEQDIWDAPLPQPVKEVLARFWRDRCLIPLRFTADNKEFAIAWNHQDSTPWKSLNSEEKAEMEALFAHKQEKMEALWEKHARDILGALCDDTATMIPCAEDLGVDMKCLPGVLADKGILSLRVIRWAREWGEQGDPYAPFDAYPTLSVTTTSVHDSSSLREWWEKEEGGKDYLKWHHHPDLTPGTYTADTARALLEDAASSRSAFCIHPLQDFLGLVDTYRSKDSADDRINVPGTVSKANWTYRLPVSIDALSADEKLAAEIGGVVSKHG